MHHRLAGFHAHLTSWHYLWSEALIVLLFAVLVFASPASAAMRFQERSLYIESALPSAVTSYTVKFRYMSPDAVGSVNLLFCLDPIPYHPCEKPEGLDVSGAVLSEQLGEVGFAISEQSENHLVLTRIPGVITSPSSSYKFDNIVNPSDPTEAFSIRLRSHASMDASGPQIDFGSVRAQVTNPIMIETQVPPMLIFCLAEEVYSNCSGTNDTYYTDMGTLDPSTTLTAHSEMAVGTNASGGFAITANGPTLSAGTNIIDSMPSLSESQPGSNQFGINLVANTSPAVGKDPEGDWANAITSPEYSVPDRYKYVSGEVVAYSPNVSLMKEFTVSYIVNSKEDLPAGVYSTTITFIASGQF